MPLELQRSRNLFVVAQRLQENDRQQQHRSLKRKVVMWYSRLSHIECIRGHEHVAQLRLPILEQHQWKVCACEELAGGGGGGEPFVCPTTQL